MGLYSSTFLCFGKFNGTNDVVVADKIQVASIDGIIESKEWRAGTVDITEVEKRLETWQINLEQDDDADLFLEESTTCTMDFPWSSTSRFILVKRGVKFVKKEVDG
jgi:hypothetical protein